ncbi:hypothetical protein CJP72_12185 [Citrobacter sp. NCU1]|uniref:hypothetical protein n=1 Tax=Citrobacter sp. NCU1 TaxID=2026683 RepID=UPI001390AED4|nr:hypothetical protein [Citrobacter sp. NCU1]NDO81496.1 hypothetical protein [Citrobacter sp. NCU1]
MSDRFYMACLRDTVGTNMSFHCVDGHGYNTNIDSAHVYTQEEAQAKWNKGRDIDLPVSADCIDALAVWHVDCQKIPNTTTLVDGCNAYVAFVTGKWDGNDVYWLADGSLPTTDFSKAAIYPAARQDSEGLVWLPFSTVDAVKRRTFNINLLNRRKMVQGAGLRVPALLKRRKRKNTGKTRWNCPYCGRISWQLNPYDFEGCRNYSCEGAR